MMISNSGPLRNFWYLALSGAQLKKGGMKSMMLLGEPIVLARKADGSVFALRNICPHRGMPLHHGSFDGCEISCCYHGWTFDGQGHCTRVPSLVSPQDKYGDRIKVRTYPCREIQGCLWVFVGDASADDPNVPEAPVMPHFGEVVPQVHCSLRYSLNADQAAYTLMDPSHVAYVHSSVLVKRGAQTLREKKKEFEPAPFGWKMKQHTAPRENYVYRLFGRNVTTEISYALPGRRLEVIRGEKHCAVSLLLTTPLTENETEIHQTLYWSMNWLNPVRGLFHVFINRFLKQDRTYALLHQEGLAFNPTNMLVGDGDLQIQWFQRLKQEWLLAEAQKRPFINPLQPQTLRFRS